MIFLPSSSHSRAVWLCLLLLIILALSACSRPALMTKKDLIEYDEEAQNPSDQLAEINRQAAEIQTLLNQAQTALEREDVDAAASAYQAVLRHDAENLRAKDGLHRIALYQRHQSLFEASQTLAEGDLTEQASAMEKLSVILRENPQHDAAGKVYRQLQEAENTRRLEAMKTKLAYTAPVSLEFRDTELKVIIEALAKGTGVNFTLDGDVSSELRSSLFVRNVPLEQAIDVLVQSNNLRKKVLSKDTVLLYPDTVAKIRQYQDLMIRSFYLEYADPETIASLLRSMLGIKQVETDQRLPMVMIKDVPQVMALAEKLIASQDRPEPEVMLEIEIIEVSRNITQDVGVRWPNQLSVLSSQDTLTLEQLRDVSSSTTGVSPNPALLFGAQDAQINLLSNPRIRVKNRQTAKILIGDRLPIITSNVSSTGVISENVQYIDVGLKLDAIPDINLGGDVNIQLNLDVSSVGNSITTNSGSVVFQIGTRSTSTQLRLKDGETQVLAGLISDSDRKSISKVPGIGDLPFFGRLFSTHSDEVIKTELVLSITPRIIRPSTPMPAGLSQYWVGSELQTGRSFNQPRSREEISKLFTPGIAPEAARSQQTETPPPAPPEGLNMTLPPGLSSDF